MNALLTGCRSRRWSDPACPLPVIAFTLTAIPWPEMPGKSILAPPLTWPVYESAGTGMDAVVIAHFGQSTGIREDMMNGYLPYRETSPAARVGSVRGWQADILRGES